MTDPAGQPVSRCEPEGHCITCGDDGVAMRVVRVDEIRALASCADADGAEHTVDPELVGPVTPGDVVLVHAGVALARLESGEAAA